MTVEINTLAEPFCSPHQKALSLAAVWTKPVLFSRIHFCLSQEFEDMRMAISAIPLEDDVWMSAWVLKSAGMDAGGQAGLIVLGPCLALPKGAHAAGSALRG